MNVDANEVVKEIAGQLSQANLDNATLKVALNQMVSELEAYKDKYGSLEENNKDAE
ncbi:hypothetical protein [Enterococcus gallinarum]|uniref:hypothetical protein n=1 Tax=Enterococcus gallinarum TaxID=1353 RepID=UPI00189AFEDA|nr:hypothetical protein [Enterococcus gallinarum]